jgi:hypothetical protein
MEKCTYLSLLPKAEQLRKILIPTSSLFIPFTLNREDNYRLFGVWGLFQKRAYLFDPPVRRAAHQGRHRGTVVPRCRPWCAGNEIPFEAATKPQRPLLELSKGSIILCNNRRNLAACGAETQE